MTTLEMEAIARARKLTPTPWRMIPTPVGGIFHISGKDTTTCVAQFVAKINAEHICGLANGLVEIVRERNEVAADRDKLLAFAETVARSACLDQQSRDKCICFACEAKRLLSIPLL